MSPRTLAWPLAVFSGLGCAGSRGPTPNYPYVPTSDYAIAGAFTGVAAVIYASGGGCKISDCPADTVCNPSSERCERISCEGPRESAKVCPAGSQCQSSTGTCVPF